MFDNRTYAELKVKEAQLKQDMHREIATAKDRIRHKYAYLYEAIVKEIREAAIREGLHTPRT